jgi:protocatechuate 3,4-dioxygenase beta subunit
MTLTRRHVALSLLAGAATAPFLTGLTGAQEFPPQLTLTPSCRDDDEPTPAQTEGPYFTPSSPQRNDLSKDGLGGNPLLIGGMVLDRACRPLSNALIELWHADAEGSYDNEGYRYRGHSFSDREGRWWFDTIVPGRYTGRTLHYHLKVQRPGGSMLTTQLYFPDEPQNTEDRIFNPALLLRLEKNGSERFGLFDFVVA